MTRTTLLLVIPLLGLAAGGTTGALASRSAIRGPLPAQGLPVTELFVPRATSDIRIDGELDEATWNDSAARTGPLVSGGDTARPYSDARFTWRDGTLYVALYAADENIVAPEDTHDQPLWTGDYFQLVFRQGDVERLIDVSPRGIVTDARREGGGPFDARWESRAKVAVDRDGTLDDPSDEDEEWVVEMAIPMDALGLTGARGERIGLELRRCDRLRSADGTSRRTCATWGDRRSQLVLE
jgi:hypothetical protein